MKERALLKSPVHTTSFEKFVTDNVFCVKARTFADKDLIKSAAFLR
jgi:hypothetical protein